MENQPKKLRKLYECKLAVGNGSRALKLFTLEFALIAKARFGKLGAKERRRKRMKKTAKPLDYLPN